MKLLLEEKRLKNTRKEGGIKTLIPLKSSV
jgi:hypothetical protein